MTVTQESNEKIDRDQRAGSLNVPPTEPKLLENIRDQLVSLQEDMQAKRFDMTDELDRLLGGQPAPECEGVTPNPSDLCLVDEILARIRACSGISIDIKDQINRLARL